MRGRGGGKQAEGGGGGEELSHKHAIVL
jgi:hypothetical protein